MNWILKLLSYFLRMFTYQYAAKRAKRQGILVYMKSLQVVRKGLALVLITFFIFQVMLIGFIGAIVSGVWLLPIDDQSIRIWIVFGVFLTLFLIPFIALTIFFSDRVWFKLSGAEKMMNSELEETGL